jgi:hypothetical protein
MSKLKCHVTFMHTSVTPETLRMLALCVTFASRHYQVVVVTNLTKILDPLGMPCDIKQRDYTLAVPWSVHKIRTYSEAEGSDPFIHIDSDVFLVDPLPNDVLSANLFAQSLEGDKHYQNIEFMPKDWKENYLPVPFRAFNCGVFGGNPASVRGFAAVAMAASRDCGSGIPATWCEQAVLGRFDCKTLLDVSDETGEPIENGVGYIHLMESKRRPDQQDRVRARLEQENPIVAARLDPPKPGVASAGKVKPNDILDFYKRARPAARPIRFERYSPEQVTLTVSPMGLGDVTILTDIERCAASVGRKAYIAKRESETFRTVVKFCPSHSGKRTPLMVCLTEAYLKSGCGPGHLIQRAQRMFELPVDPVPRGNILVPGRFHRHNNRISIHATPGTHVDWQRELLHPRARSLYPDTISAIYDLAGDKKFTLVEVGSKRCLDHRRIEDGTGGGIENMFRIMTECEYHIGILSGPAHVAAAMGLKLILVINFPEPEKLMLPNLVDMGIVEEEWIPPQACVLHQDHDSRHWPLLTPKSLRSAVAGEVYPYWDNSILHELSGFPGFQ